MARNKPILPVMGRLFSRTAWLFVAITASCGHTSKLKVEPAAPGRPLLEQAEDAMALGDPVAAIDLLEDVSKEETDFDAAQELLELARVEQEAIIEDLIAGVDLLLDQQRFRDAMLWCNYIEKGFPLSPELRGEVEQRKEAVLAAVKMARSTLDRAEQEARDALLAGRYDKALKTLRGALDLAWEVDRDRALEMGRVIAATDLRAAQPGDERLTRKNGDSSARAARLKRAAARRKKLAEARAAASAATEAAKVEKPPAGGPAPTVSQAERKVHNLLQEAKRLKKSGDFFEAIKTYLEVREIEPKNAEASSGLKQLEAKRKALVKDYLRKANDHFLKQELAAAAPYYKRVLVLDPGNKRAAEGVRMHENLERIRKERKDN